MKNISDAVSGSIKYLGQGFLLAFYLPALVFILVHIYVLIPSWIGVQFSSQKQITKLTLPLIGEINLSSLIDILLWPLIVGMILFILNSTLIKLFEGKSSWLGERLLGSLTKRNRKRCEKFYGELVQLQDEYRKQAKNLIEQTQSPEQQINIKQKLGGLAKQIEEEHKNIEKLQAIQTLPHDIHRICPTSFGNAYAIAEEYPYERYGIDAVLFWTRLREVMQEKAAGHSLRLTQQKIVLDLSINFAFISSFIAVELVLTLVFLGYKNLLLILIVVALIFSISSYRASVAAIQIMGELIKTSFDYHRGLILQAFNLKMPDKLSEEQVLWVKLAAFIRRGDAFYFPEEYREPENKNNGFDEGKTKDEQN